MKKNVQRGWGAKYYLTLVTGGFDIVHSGHLAMIKEASNFEKIRSFFGGDGVHVFDGLYVGVNSDEWLVQKKGYYAIPFKERLNLMKNIKGVETAFGFQDDDAGTACNAILTLKDFFPDHTIIFCNGGDRSDKNSIPEYEVFKDDPNVKFAFSVGGNTKLNSSSDLIPEIIERYLTRDSKNA